MNEKNLTEQILETIKKKGIKPRPRWEFLLKDYVIWLLSIACLIIGGLAFSVIIYMFKNNDWDVYQYISGSLLSFVLVTLPYFWILFLIIFILAAHYNFKHTKSGYKYQLELIIVTSIVINVFLGIIWYNLGMGHLIDRTLAERMPFYERFGNRRRMLWLEPGKGMLAGEIVTVGPITDPLADEESGLNEVSSTTTEMNFQLKDLEGKVWNVLGEKAIIMPEAEISTSTKVRVMGEKIDEDNFRAKRIAPGMPGMLPPGMPGGPPGMRPEERLGPKEEWPGVKGMFEEHLPFPQNLGPRQ